MRVVLRDDSILVGDDGLRLTFHRTLRIPDDGRNYPLPPGLGRFPVLAADAYRDRLPQDWRGAHSFLIPLYQREALWLGFGKEWPPVAIAVATGRVNAISGQPQGDGLHADPQDYLVCPEQMWLDGVNAGPGTVRQFVAMPLGQGYTVEAGITGREQHGGIQITVFGLRPGVGLSPPPPHPPAGPMRMSAPPRMGLGAGGRIAQKIYPDPHGLAVWDQSDPTLIAVHLVNSLAYRALTGSDPPPTPIDARTYSARGYPWFRLYEEHLGDVPAAGALAGVTTIAERDRERGQPLAEDGFDVDPSQIETLGGPPCPKD